MARRRVKQPAQFFRQAEQGSLRTVSNSNFLGATCSLQQVPDTATSPTDREVVEADVALEGPFPASKEAKERAEMATTAQAYTAYVVPLTAVPSTDMRLNFASIDYRIRGVSPWPAGTPDFYELLIERDR